MAHREPHLLAAELYAQCRRHGNFDRQLLAELIATDSPVLFRDLVEPLCDSFEPALCDVYDDLFQSVIRAVLPGIETRTPASGRYESKAPENVYVLSRVTLGADVAVTSVMLDAAKKAFPSAAIHFVGPQKNFELFDADPRVRHLSAPYARTASLRARLEASAALRGVIPQSGAIVIDPDSRLTQLGLIPVCPDANYFFFPGRRMTGLGTLSSLASEWARQTFGVTGARSYVAPAFEPRRATVTVSLGVGENPAKRIADPFEAKLLRGIVDRGLDALIDYGAGGEESERVHRAIEAAGAKPGQIQTWRGAYAPFAASIAASRLYIGYDSSGQHVAAAGGVPLITVFAGEPNERFFERWQPSGNGRVQIVRGPDPLDQTLRALDMLLERSWVGSS